MSSSALHLRGGGYEEDDEDDDFESHKSRGFERGTHAPMDYEGFTTFQQHNQQHNLSKEGLNQGSSSTPTGNDHEEQDNELPQEQQQSRMFSFASIASGELFRFRKNPNNRKPPKGDSKDLGARRQKEERRALQVQIRDMDIDDDDAGKRPSPIQHQHNFVPVFPPTPSAETQPGFFSRWCSCFGNLDPYHLIGYVQLLSNIIMVGIFIGSLVSVVRVFARDIDLKAQEYSKDIEGEIQICAKNYYENKCLPGERIPAMDKTCIIWENCMNRDPSQLGWSKISAETIAEILNSFVEPISYKTMFFIFASMIVLNLCFRLLRAATHHPAPHPPVSQSPHPSPLHTQPAFIPYPVYQPPPLHQNPYQDQLYSLSTSKRRSRSRSRSRSRGRSRD